MRREWIVPVLLMPALLAFVAGCGPAAADRPGAGAGDGDLQAGDASPQTPDPQPANFASIDEALAALQKAAGEGNGRGVSAAQLWLSKGGDQALQKMAQIAEDDGADLRLRLSVVPVLGNMGPAARPVLMRCLNDKETLVRRQAVKALAVVKPRNSETVTTLIGLIDDPDAAMRQDAIHSLGAIGPQAARAVSRLERVLQEDESQVVRTAAMSALKKIDPRRTFED